MQAAMTITRKGRKRKLGPRRASGALMPDSDDPRSVVMSQPHRRGLQVRYDDRGRVISDERLDQYAGTPLGRLRLSKSISEVEYEAGEQFARVRGRYLPVLSIPDDTRRTIVGTGAGLEDDEALARLRSFNEAYRALTRAGPEALRVVTKVAVSQHDPEGVEYSYLLVGLRTLVAHWGLTRTGKSGH